MTIRPTDFFGASQNSVLNKPLIHVQDKNPINTAVEALPIGINQKILNTVILNQIPGASLVSNSVILPAGTYFISFEGELYQSVGGYSRALITDINNNVLLQGNNGESYYTSHYAVSGNITLAMSTTIKAMLHITTGAAVTANAPMNSTYPEVYGDLKIWQLDATVKTPVLSNNQLYPLPGTSFVEGNMYGLDFAKTGANQVTIQPGICMDSLNTTLLNLAAQQALSLPTTVNGIFNLFLCNDGVVRYDTDVNGSALSAYKIRWFGYVPNNASGVIKAFVFKGGLVNEIWFDRFADNTINSSVAVPTGITTAISITSFLPSSRVISAYIGVIAASGPQSVSLSGVSGTSDTVNSTSNAVYQGSGDIYEFGIGGGKFIPMVDGNVYWGRGTSPSYSNVQLAIQAVKIRR